MKHKGNVRNILIDTVKKQKWAVQRDPDRSTWSHRSLSDPAASSWKNRGQYYGRTCGSVSFFVLYLLCLP